MFKELCAWGLPGPNGEKWNPGWNMTNEDMLIKTLNLAKATGYEGIEIRIEAITKITQEKSIYYVKDLFSEAKIIPGGWELTTAWRSDEKEYQKMLEILPLWVKTSQALECRRPFLWTLSYSDEMNYKENFQWHIKRLQPVVNILKDYNLRLGIEWMAPKTCRKGHKYEFIHDMKGALSLVEAIDKDNTGLLLDSWHWYISNGTLEDIKQLKPEQIVYVHFNDAPKDISIDEQIDLERAVPGETGVIDCVGFLKALKEIGYDGPVEPAAPGAKALENKSVQEAARINCEALTKLMQAAGII